MRALIFIMPGNEAAGLAITQGMNGEPADFILREFPDGETYLRILSLVENREVIIICNMHEPNRQILALYFLCTHLRELKAGSLCLVSPYLAYMRQDKAFQTGEATSSRYFASLISSLADQIVTIDPHLHRTRSLGDIFSIPFRIGHAAGPVAAYITSHFPLALLVGPDSESEQWVSEIARLAGIPYLIFKKTRLGDREVKIETQDINQNRDHTPILLDDMISTGTTMLTIAKVLIETGMKPPVCLAIHAIFAGSSYEQLKASGISDIITCNSIPHASNRIDIFPVLISLLSEFINTP